MMQELITVGSRMLHAVGYDPQKQVLEAIFYSGKIYCYEGVPQKIYQDLMIADSKGQYMRSKIIDSYPTYQFGISYQ